jgi:hypothetical protein
MSQPYGKLAKRLGIPTSNAPHRQRIAGSRRGRGPRSRLSEIEVTRVGSVRSRHQGRRTGAGRVGISRDVPADRGRGPSADHERSSATGSVSAVRAGSGAAADLESHASLGDDPTVRDAHRTRWIRQVQLPAVTASLHGRGGTPQGWRGTQRPANPRGRATRPNPDPGGHHEHRPRHQHQPRHRHDHHADEQPRSVRRPHGSGVSGMRGAGAVRAACLLAGPRRLPAAQFSHADATALCRSRGGQISDPVEVTR